MLHSTEYARIVSGRYSARCPREGPQYVSSKNVVGARNSCTVGFSTMIGTSSYAKPLVSPDADAASAVTPTRRAYAQRRDRGHRARLNRRMCQMAATPSRQPIFLPSAYVRPEYEIGTS